MSSIHWSSAAATHVGGVRKINEDSIYDGSAKGLWVVADGMGGHSAGDVASQLIVSALSQFTPTSDFSESVDSLENTLINVNSTLVTMSQAAEPRRVIGSTVVLFFVSPTGAAVCLWVGDSRLYRLRNNALQQLSQDHSQIEEMISGGVIRRQDAEMHSSANIITRAIGGDKQLYVDIDLIDIKAGDIFLLCSDGLYKELSEEEIMNQIIVGETPPDICAALVDESLKKGGIDNLSVIVINFS
jgi:serine/threonine protein phosphatase PrpC